MKKSAKKSGKKTATKALARKKATPKKQLKKPPPKKSRAKAKKVERPTLPSAPNPFVAEMKGLVSPDYEDQALVAVMLQVASGLEETVFAHTRYKANVSKGIHEANGNRAYRILVQHPTSHEALFSVVLQKPCYPVTVLVHREKPVTCEDGVELDAALRVALQSGYVRERVLTLTESGRTEL